MASKVEQVLEIVRDMKVTELSELVSAFEEEFNVSAAAPVAAVAAAGAGDAGAGAEEEEQTEFDVLITNAGDKKIPVIKVVRELTGLGLKEAKAVVDGAEDGGSPVKEGVTAEEAEDVKRQLEEVGASVEVR